MTGKVWLVGAGPADPGLLTLKGKEVLSQAEIVVYDALVSPEILALAPDHARCINAGKRANRHLLSQEEINRILLAEALAGKRVVRLKGGDPFLFGRGAEELELLNEYGIPYEIVPGVTSAICVPAYNGIPVTHREYASAVHIIAGHRKQGETCGLDFRTLAALEGTLVFLMGAAALSDICAGLISGGMDPTTPAAILENGATSEQRRVISTLKSLPEEAAEAGIGTPAVIVVGKVCSFAEKFAWAERRPLFGCRVVVTRPKERAGEFAARLRAKGAQVIEIPAIRTEPVADNAPLRDALARLASFDWVVFTSPFGVRVFLDAMRQEKKDVRSLGGVRIAALGSGTAGELERAGLFADLTPEIYDGRHLGEELSKCLADGDRVLLPRARRGSPELVREITKKPGVILEEVALYDTFFESPAAVDERKEFERHPQTMAVFTSASTVKGFAAAVKGLELKNVRALCIGKQTAAEAERCGMCVYTAKTASMDGQFRYTVDRLLYKTEELLDAGVDKMMLFGIPAEKDEVGSGAYAEDGIVQKGFRAVKERFPEMYCIGDVCMCEYTSHGHCGILRGREVDNDETVKYLARIALSQVEAGADMVAPSDMMDGRVAAIRKLLDANGHEETPIMSYAVKYASAFYGPFREAAGSAPAFGDRKSYQMDFHNRREAVKEALLDLEEGADIIMVKPAMAYGDVIHELKTRLSVPIAAYNVSGEYAMVKSAARCGCVDETAILCEIAASAFRAGADIYLTYFAKELAQCMDEGRIG